MTMTITINRMSTLASTKANVPGSSGAAQHDAVQRKEGPVRTGQVTLLPQGGQGRTVTPAQGITPTAAFVPSQGGSGTRWRTSQPIISSSSVRKSAIQARHESATNKPHQQALPVALASPVTATTVAAATSGQSVSGSTATLLLKSAQESVPAVKRLHEAVQTVPPVEASKAASSVSSTTTPKTPKDCPWKNFSTSSSTCVPVPITTLLKRLFPNLFITPPARASLPAVRKMSAATSTVVPANMVTPAVVPASASVVPAATTVAAQPLPAASSVPAAVVVASPVAPAVPERPAGGKDNSGNDNLVGTKAADTLWGGSGNDAMFGLEGDDRLFGQDGDDQILGSEGADLLDGGAGNDRLFGGQGNDKMWGGDGDDTMAGSDLGNTGKPLAAGQTDDDSMSGGAGNDRMLGGAGNDQMWGGTGNDDLSGNEGDDKLYGEAGDDQLCGGQGNDVIQGGDGDDLINGDDVQNFWKQPDANGGNDLLYGGAGNDALVGGAGNDLLDGGSGNDKMSGGLGDDTYVVDCAGDTVSENAGEGHDTVVASSSFTLGRNVEDLRLAEGGQFNGTGNTLNNVITGNSRDNILDGGRGADTLIGGAGKDTYFIDDVNDKIVEKADEGIDTVVSRISTTLGSNLENLTLVDSATPQLETINGQDMLVYGYPHYFDLDYSQGDGVAGYNGTCGETSVVNLCIMAGLPATEAEAVNRAINNGWCNTSDPAHLGASNMIGQIALLDSYGIRAKSSYGYDEKALAKVLKDGRGALLAVNAGKLWDKPSAVQQGNSNHLVTVTGVVCDPRTGEVQGFFIADSGRGRPQDASRYMTKDELRKVADVPDSYMIATVNPIKVSNENLTATGNELNNVITGNRGANLITGGRGNDSLIGGAGNDTYRFARGDGQDVITDEDATLGNVDTLQLSDLRQTNLWFSQTGNDLQIDVLGSSDRVTIKNWYRGGSSRSDNHIERIRTADGNTLYDSDVDKLVQAMASFAPPPASQTEWKSGQTSQGKVLLTITH